MILCDTHSRVDTTFIISNLGTGMKIYNIYVSSIKKYSTAI